MAGAARRDASISEKLIVSLILDHVDGGRSPGQEVRHDA
jgi:hypothetical protein